MALRLPILTEHKKWAERPIFLDNGKIFGSLKLLGAAMSDAKIDQHAKDLVLEIFRTKASSSQDLAAYDFGLSIDDGIGKSQRVRILVTFLVQRPEEGN